MLKKFSYPWQHPWLSCLFWLAQKVLLLGFPLFGGGSLIHFGVSCMSESWIQPIFKTPFLWKKFHKSFSIGWTLKLVYASECLLDFVWSCGSPLHSTFDHGAWWFGKGSPPCESSNSLPFLVGCATHGGNRRIQWEGILFRFVSLLPLFIWGFCFEWSCLW